MPSAPLTFSQNQTLFGWNDTSGIVSLELEGEHHVRVYRREGGRVVSELQEFRPLLWVQSGDVLRDFKAEFELRELRGHLFFRALAVFHSWNDVNAAKKYLSKSTGKQPSDKSAPYLFLNDPIHQHLLATGQTSFRSMTFRELNRLQIDIETYCSSGFEFPNPEREEDCIIAVALSDSSGWEAVLWGKELSEAEILMQLNAIIRERDPDVIEGHNLFKFDLPYLRARARRHNIALNWGRDGTEPSFYNSRIFIAERTIDYPKWQIQGRHVVDTWILSQYYDIGSRELEGLGLKEMAQHFGLTQDNRTYIEGGQISRIYDERPDELHRYALDDVRETRGLADLLVPSYFIQAQIFPYNFQDVVVRGNATKINALFLREYLRQHHSLPLPPGESKEFAGGYTDIFKEGVVKNVVHCDVTSLYPSIMLARHLKPAQDELGIFLTLLKDLRTFRVEAKRMAQRVTSSELRGHYQALQTTFKILINSFYGYLGTSFSHFADFNAAAEVTDTGQRILRHMIGWLQQQQCDVIELDTDGIYFVPPPGRSDPEQAERLVAELASTLPAGIEVELDGHYPAMFSYKMKNYALLGPGDKPIIKGSGLRSRGLERFQRQFLREMILLLLKGEAEKVSALYAETLAKFDRHEWVVEDFCKTETLSESLAGYQQKLREGRRNASALYELALRSGRLYQPGDPLSYYVTGTKRNVKAYENCKLASEWDPAHPDENVGYYKTKLEELLEKFKAFLPNPPQSAQLTLPLE
jgi:DNA polymerase elongation subunit (family B)